MRTFVLPFSTLLALAFAPLARAEPPINTNHTAHALGGYDVVAYFTDGHPLPGKPEHVATHGGARWLFASAEHKALFEKAPGKYLPAYGGYCAYGVSRGYLVQVDPAAFSIRHGKLYLNKSLRIRATWLQDPDGYIAKADANWPKL
jgi:YHS domain-containing protein